MTFRGSPGRAQCRDQGAHRGALLCWAPLGPEPLHVQQRLGRLNMAAKTPT